MTLLPDSPLYRGQPRVSSGTWLVDDYQRPSLIVSSLILCTTALPPYPPYHDNHASGRINPANPNSHCNPFHSDFSNASCNDCIGYGIPVHVVYMTIRDTRTSSRIISVDNDDLIPSPPSWLVVAISGVTHCCTRFNILHHTGKDDRHLHRISLYHRHHP